MKRFLQTILAILGVGLASKVAPVLSTVQTNTIGNIQFSCPNGWEIYRSSCYLPVNLNRRWKDALNTCQTYGSELVQIDFGEEYDEVQKMMNKDMFWIGLNMLKQKEQNKYDAHWGMKIEANLCDGHWNNGQPDLKAGDCVSGHSESWWSVEDCERKLPFVCEIAEACLKDFFWCRNSKCLNTKWVCDGFNDCGDYSDEMNCPEHCRRHMTEESGQIQVDSSTHYKDKETCLWSIETAVGTRIKLTLSANFELEKNADTLQIYSGGPTLKKVTQLKVMSGKETSSIIVHSINNFIILRLSIDDSIMKSGFTVAWQTEIPEITDNVISLIATSSWQDLTSPFYGENFLPFDLRMEWIITTSMAKVMMLQFIEIDVSPGYVKVHDMNESWSKKITEVIPYVVITYSSSVRIELVTERSGLGRGMRIQYKEGCDVILSDMNSGMIASPGYLVKEYPNNIICTWKISISASMSRELTMRIEEFNLSDNDYLEVYEDVDKSNALHTNNGFTGNNIAPKMLRSEGGLLVVQFNSSYSLTATGFRASFSIDCPMLNVSQGTSITNQDNKAADVNTAFNTNVLLTCGTGYSFKHEEYNHTSSLEMQCQSGGEWDSARDLDCQITYCGIPTPIKNGFLENITGIKYEAEATYKCLDGFNPIGTTTVKCLANGQWDSLPMCKASTCSEVQSLSDSHRKHSFENSNTVDSNEFGTVITFTCDSGFDLHGATRIHCQQNDKWSHATPTCERILCPLPVIPNALLSLPSVTEFESEITVTCNDGYIINGTVDNKAITQCQSDQTYSDIPPCVDDDECERQSPCLAHQTCTNNIGSYVCDCVDGYVKGTNGCDDVKECDTDRGGCSDHCTELIGSYTCYCRPGREIYTKDGMNNISLASGEDGTLFGDIRYINHTCVRMQCYVPSEPNNGMILTQKQHFYYMDEIEYRCNFGYVQSEGNVKQTCVSDEDGGMWNGSALVCKIASCNVITDSLSGSSYVLIPGGVTTVDFGGSLNIECDIDGGGKVKLTQYCQYDNIDQTFKLLGDEPICPVIDCGVPKTLPGSDYSNKDGNTYESSFTISCHEEFKLEGAAEGINDTDIDKRFKVFCNKHGRWGFGTLSCDGGRCTDPGTPAGATQIVQFSYEINQLVYFNCSRNGFEPDTNFPLQCIYDENSFKWNSTTSVVCKDVTSPTFSGCPTEDIYVDVMSAADYEIPQAKDNSEVIASVVVDPPYFVPFVIITSNTTVTYKASDFAGNSQECSINFKIINRSPQSLTCSGPQTVNINTTDGKSVTIPDLVTSDSRWTKYVYHPSEVVTLNTSTLDSLIVVMVEAFDMHTSKAMCTFVINTKAEVCLEDYLPSIHNAGNPSCSTTDDVMKCDVTCDSENIFSSGQDQMSFTCTNENIWNPALPPEHCQSFINPSYWIYIKVTYLTFVAASDCKQSHESKLNTMLTALNQDLTKFCKVSGNLITVIVTTEVDGVKLLTTFSIEDSDASVDIFSKKYCKDQIQSKSGTVLNMFTYAEEINCNSESGNVEGQSLNVLEEKTGSGCPPKSEKSTDEKKCVPCLPGKYYSSSNGSCIACPDGEYQDEAGQTECKNCPAVMKPANSKDHCIVLCPKGFWSDDGIFPCYPCPEDHYWTNSSSPCAPCQTDYSTVGNLGAIDDTYCKAPCGNGSYSYTGYEPCKECPPNYYQDKKGETTCEPCPDGKINQQSGSVSENTCEDADPLLCDDSANDCKGNGACSVTRHYKVCSCNSDYYGQECSTFKDPCLAEPCFNGGTCSRTNANTYTCECPSENNCTINQTADERIKGETFYNSETVTTVNECKDLCEADDQCMTAYETDNGICFFYDDSVSSLTVVKEEKNILLVKSCENIPYFTGDQCQNDILDGCPGNADCGDYGMCHDLPDVNNGFECICQITGEYSGDNCQRDTELCIPNPCKHDGKCKSFGEERHYCICSPGYTGENCEKDINECDANPDGCLYNGTCGDGINKYQCTCLEGFSGDHCEEAPDFCTSSECENGLCYSDMDMFDAVCVCKDGYEVGEDGQCNTKEPSCEDVRCINGTCHNGVCRCDDGFEGSECQHGTNNCEPEPCIHGTCDDLHRGYSCACDDGYEGENCELNINDCSSLPCNSNNKVKCIDEIADYSCECKPGFMGKNCSQEINECETKYPCKHGSTCEDIIDDYTCNCTEGWEGKNCDNEKNYCSNNTCHNAGKCQNLIDGYICSCVIGTYGDTCENFPDVCEVFENKKLEPCKAGTCEKASGETYCDCSSDYTGVSCHLIKDYCATGLMTCENGGTCSSKNIGYECECKPGYTGSRCQRYINPCESINCVGTAVCHSKGDKHLCLCPHGKTNTESGCKDTFDDYDIIFDADVSPTGAVSLFPFVMNSSGISIMMFVRFAGQRPISSVLKLYESNIDDEQTWPSDDRDVLLDVNETSVIFKNGTDELTVTFSDSSGLAADNNWHHLGITWSIDGNIVVVLDAIGKYDEAKVFPFSYYLVGKLLLGRNFHGRLSRITVWSGELSYRDLSLASDDVNYTPTNTLLQAWTNLFLSEGTTRSYPSNVKNNNCGPVLNGDCSDIADKEPPKVVVCRDDMTFTSTQRINNIAKFQDVDVKFEDEVNVTTTLPEDMGFMKGVHEAIYVATDEENNYAQCRFRIYVRYNENCAAIRTSSGHNYLVDCKDGENSYTFDNCEGKNRFKPLPRMMSCGKLGIWDWKNPNSELVIPSCSESEVSFTRVIVKVIYEFSISCTQNLIDQLEIDISTSFKDKVAGEWTGLCSAECSNLDVTVTCSSEKLKEAIVVVDLSHVMETVKKTGFILNPMQALRKIFLEDDMFMYPSIGGSKMLKRSFEFEEMMSCEDDNVLIGPNCVTCGVGSYYNQTTNSCDFCEIDKYQDEIGQTECKPCSSDEATLFTGSYTESQCIEKCTAGNYFHGTSCSKCPLDHYQDEENKAYCEECPLKKRTKGHGSTSLSSCVDDCPSGSDLKDDNSSDCVECRIGFYRTAGNERECKQCPTNWMTKNAGSQKIDDCNIFMCPSGQYWYNPDEDYQYHTDGQDECNRCPLGQYQPDPHQRDCIKCTTSYSTRNMGSVNETDCISVCLAGEQYNHDANKCENCPLGTWSNGNNSMKFGDCLKCSDNMTTEGDGSNSTDDCNLLDCPPGSYIFSTGSHQECKLCSVGDYQPDRHQTICIHCEGNQSSAEGSTSMDDCKINCPAGEEGSDMCEKCIDDHFKATAGNFACEKCPGDETSDELRKSCDLVRCREGKYYIRDGVAESCRNCMKGYYKDVKANDNCTLCPEGNTTTGEGSINVAMCNRTSCPKGFYYVQENGEDNCVSCEVGTFKNVTGNDEDCRQCPAGFTTDGNAKTSEADCSQADCDRGEYYIESSDKCMKCELGYYKQMKDNNINCSKCVEGKTTNKTGSTSINDCNIEDCTRGQRRSEGQGCENCAIGTYQPRHYQTDCLICKSNRTTADEGSKDEKQCIDTCMDGFFFKYSSDRCVKCPLNYITNHPDDHFCVKCPNQQVTYMEGATKCRSSGNVTVALPRKVTTNIKMKFKAQNCGRKENVVMYLGIIKNLVMSSLQALSLMYNGLCSLIHNNNCESIKIKKTNSNCNPSARRKRELENGQLEFEITVPNVESSLENYNTKEVRQLESVIEEDMSDGLKYSSEENSIIFLGLTEPVSTVLICDPGQIDSNNKCVMCPAGKIQNGNECDLCEKDYYQDEPGKTTCKKCDGPRSTTNSTGSSSEDDCQFMCDTNQDFCKNGGRCITDEFDVRCECNEYYEGDQCELFEDQSKNSKQELIIGLSVGGIVALLFIILMITVIINYLRKRNSDKASSQTMEREQLYRNPLFNNDVFGPHLPGFSHRVMSLEYPVEGYDQKAYYCPNGEQVESEEMAYYYPDGELSDFEAVATDRHHTTVRGHANSRYSEY